MVSRLATVLARGWEPGRALISLLRCNGKLCAPQRSSVARPLYAVNGVHAGAQIVFKVSRFRLHTWPNVLNV